MSGYDEQLCYTARTEIYENSTKLTNTELPNTYRDSNNNIRKIYGFSAYTEPVSLQPTEELVDYLHFSHDTPDYGVLIDEIENSVEIYSGNAEVETELQVDSYSLPDEKGKHSVTRYIPYRHLLELENRTDKTRITDPADYRLKVTFNPTTDVENGIKYYLDDTTYIHCKSIYGRADATCDATTGYVSMYTPVRTVTGGNIVKFYSLDDPSTENYTLQSTLYLPDYLTLETPAKPVSGSEDYYFSHWATRAVTGEVGNRHYEYTRFDGFERKITSDLELFPIYAEKYIPSKSGTLTYRIRTTPYSYLNEDGETEKATPSLRLYGTEDEYVEKLTTEDGYAPGKNVELQLDNIPKGMKFDHYNVTVRCMYYEVTYGRKGEVIGGAWNVTGTVNQASWKPQHVFCNWLGADDVKEMVDDLIENYVYPAGKDGYECLIDVILQPAMTSIDGQCYIFGENVSISTDEGATYTQSDKIKVKCGDTVYAKAAGTFELVPILITAQPADAAVDAAGETANFTVTAEGKGLTYLWQYSDDGTTWKDTSVKTGTYSIAVTAARDGRQMRCVITDANGNTFNSATATMKIG